ncbi:MAG: hypothetical protein NZ959_02405 [Armatimonadetes bacterium]|nr:hypothetical protein [Armatimonadota bacterium]MDW8120976.1 hypothetical protein [Armatimonadota bacterium]
MPPGLLLVILFLAAAGVGVFFAVRTGLALFHKWLDSPDDLIVPPASEIGPDCVVLRFADEFVPTVPASEVPPWQRFRYHDIRNDLLVPNDELAMAILKVSLLDLVQAGKIEITVKESSETGDPLKGSDKELWLRQAGDLPLTPLGRCWSLSFKMTTRSLWLFRPERSSVPLDDLVEFAIREAKRSLGWRKAKRSASENLILYVQEFLAKRNVPESERERVKRLLSSFKEEKPELEEALSRGIKNALDSLKRIEPDRDPLSF